MSVIAPFGVPRKTTETTTLNGTHILKGTQIFANFLNPYRWFNQNRKIFDPNSKQSYTPFLAQIRVCPGKILAELELFLFDYRLFRDFQVEPVKGQKLQSFDGELGIILCPKPFKVFFTPRKNDKADSIDKENFQIAFRVIIMLYFIQNIKARTSK